MQNIHPVNKSRFAVLAGMILAAAAFRILPHPPNFSPIAALALFGGAHFEDRRGAFLLPLAAMFLGDLVLGMHSLIPVTYGCFAVIVCIGLWVRKKKTTCRVAWAAMAASLLYFAVTNLAVWAFTSMYPKSTTGLIECYVAGIPFFGHTLAGDIFYTATLFGGLALAEWRLPSLREECPA